MGHLGPSSLPLLSGPYLGWTSWSGVGWIRRMPIGELESPHCLIPLRLVEKSGLGQTSTRPKFCVNPNLTSIRLDLARTPPELDNNPSLLQA